MARPPKSRAHYPDIEKEYEVQETLGSGGFAKVKCGVHKATGEKVAIKIMDKVLLAHDLPRAAREVRVLRRLHHQHICQLFQVIETERMYYLILEFCPGGELFDYIVAREKLKESEARTFFRQIVSALMYIHEEGLCHRDLKPENLLLDDQGNIKLIDFGLCAEPEKLSDYLETSCGSPAYAAPELIQGLKYSGPKADVWSLGILLYALLNGFLPFDDEHTAYLYELIKKGEYEVPDWLSAPSVELISQLLQTRPDRRISVSDLLAHPWLLQNHGRPVDWRSRIELKDLDVDVLRAMADFHSKTPAEMKEAVKKWKYDSVTVEYFLLLQQKNRGEEPHFVVPKLQVHRVLNSSVSPPCPSPLTQKEVKTTAGTVATKDKIIFSSEDEAESNGGDALISPKEKPRKLSLGTGTGFPSAELTSLAHPLVKRVIHVEPKTAEIPSINRPHYPPPLPDLKAPISLSMSLDAHMNKLSMVDEEEERPMVTVKPPSTPQPTKRGKFFQKVFKPLKRTRAEAGPKEVKGHFTAANTSVKEPDVVLTNLMQVLRSKGFPFSRKDYKLRCQAATSRGNVEFDLEVCQMRRIDLRGVRMKRIKGDTWVYKTVCDNIVACADI